MYETPLTALVLGGGGARAAYQVGVLRALAALRRQHAPALAQRHNPFGVICGTSAGAINAAALACHADRFDTAVDVLAQVWEGFHTEQVYRSDSLGMVRSGAQWLTMVSVGWLLARWVRARPRSLLDNSPLAELLRRLVPLHRLPALLARHHLQSLAVTASSYGTGEHITFYQSGVPVVPWVRSQRLAMPAEITHDHLLASSAIPFIFPAQSLPHQDITSWFGDGSMRQTAPLSPAVHLGAQRIVVIGAGRMGEAAREHGSPRAVAPGYPTLAQIAGHALTSIFLDALALDVERMQRINQTLALLPEAARVATPLRPVQTLVLAPSQRLDDVAARHLHRLPRPVRALLRGAGVGGQGAQARGGTLASYLLFESAFTQELMALGEADVRARRDEVLAFFGWGRGADEAAQLPRVAGRGAVAGVVAAAGALAPANG